MPDPRLKNFDIIAEYEDVIVVKPRLKKGDPYDHMARLIEAPWADVYGAQTLCLDTVTVLSDCFLEMSGEAGNYANNPIEFGRGANRVVIPVEGDYRVAQSLTQKLTDLAFDLPMDLCFVGHVGVEAKGKKGTTSYDVLRAGMRTVGQAQVASYGGQFDQYIHLKYAKKQDKTSIVAQLVGDAVYAAKVREDGESPPPREVAVPNTLEEQRKWWHARAVEAGLDLANPAMTGYFRTALYGEIGTGKTRLALSMPRTPIVYIAADRGSEFLRSAYRAVKKTRDNVGETA